MLSQCKNREDASVPMACRVVDKPEPDLLEEAEGVIKDISGLHSEVEAEEGSGS